MAKNGPRQPKYRLHPPSGRAFVEIGGKRRYLGPHDAPASRQKYHRIIEHWIANGHRWVDPTPQGQHTIMQLVDIYDVHARDKYGQSGTNTGELAILRIAARGVLDLYGSHPADDFGPKALRQVRDMALAGRIRGMKGPCSPVYANKLIATLRRMFKWGVSEELVSPLTFGALQSLSGLSESGQPAKHRVLTDAEIRAVHLHLTSIVWCMVQFQRFTGCRPGEVVQLRPCDVDRSDHVWIYTPRHHKTSHRGQRREIAIGPRARAVVEDFLTREPQQPCFNPSDARRERYWRLRFQSDGRRKTVEHLLKRGLVDRATELAKKRLASGVRAPAREDIYTVASYRQAVQRACEKAGIARWTPNDLRHTALTLVRKERGLEAAQLIAGHARADVTQLYAERDRARMIEIATETG